MNNAMNLLLVEDNPGDAALVKEDLLQGDWPGLRVVEHSTWQEAAQALGVQPFDVILLDLSLPDTVGLATVDLARQAAPHTPIVVLTGLDDEELALEALRHGAQDYLVKGRTHPAVLTRAIRYACERKRLETEREDLIGQLQEALATVKQLTGLLPVCASCKRIRDEQGGWTSMEEYIRQHTDADVSHGICPDCMKRLYPQFKQ